MRRPRAVVVVLAGLALLLTACSGNAEKADLTIGVFAITSADVVDETVAGFKEEFLARTGLPADQVRFVDENAQGDASLIQSIARQFADSDADMIAVLGTPAMIAQAALVKDRPLIALAIGDPVFAGVADSLDRPGGNVTGSVDYLDPAVVLDQLLVMHPQMRRVGTVHDTSNQNSQVWIRDLKAGLDERDLDYAEATIAGSTDLPTAARSLIGRADVLLIGPDATVVGGLAAVGQVARSNRLPLYATAGDLATPGLVGTLGPDYRDLGRLAGEAAAEVHQGASPSEVAFRRPNGFAWQLNEETIGELALRVPAEIRDQGAIS